MSRSKILMLVTELQMGGAAKVVREVSGILAERFTVEEAVFNLADGVDFAGLAAPHELGVTGGGGIVRRLLNLRLRITRARALKRSLGVDLSISHLEGAHIVDVLSRGREKIVLCIHGSMLRDHEPFGISEWVRRKIVIPYIYSKADRIVTVSRDIVPQMIGLGIDPAKLMTINNSFATETIEALGRETITGDDWQMFADRPVLVTSGRLAGQKNQRPLLDVFARLLARKPLRLVILGDGELRHSLIDHARSLGLDVSSVWDAGGLRYGADVVFLGIRSNPFSLIAAAKVFVLPSSWEGFPLALCEALICGTPVVTTDCVTGPREILAPSSAQPASPLSVAEHAPFGVLMPVLHDPPTLEAAVKVWVETLAALLDDDKLLERLSAAGVERMRSFTREAIGPQWLALAEEMLADQTVESLPTTSA